MHVFFLTAAPAHAKANPFALRKGATTPGDTMPYTNHAELAKPTLKSQREPTTYMTLAKPTLKSKSQPTTHQAS